MATPIIFLRLFWRSLRLPAYRKRIGERLGFYPFQLSQCIWIHAVSVGETLAAVDFITELKKRYPYLPLLITTMTPTGSERVKKTFGETVKHVYLPYDFPGSVKRFLRSMHPRVGIIIETELWPNLLAQCEQLQIPIMLANARLSKRSAKRYLLIKSLMQKMIGQLSVIASSGVKDAKRFEAFGAKPKQLSVTGNIKYDLKIPETVVQKAADLRKKLGERRFIWIAASTHEGEEQVVLKAHQQLRLQDPDALLILVPRHPDRFTVVYKQALQEFKTIRHTLSDAQSFDADVAVYIGDTMGELLLYYAAADVCFVGGSLIPRGGHNLLEPAALEKPIVCGMHTFNFAEITEAFLAANALYQVSDQASLVNVLLSLHADKGLRKKVGARGFQLFTQNKGALERQLTLAEGMLEGAGVMKMMLSSTMLKE